MADTRKKTQESNNNVLRLRRDVQLPEHKTVAELDDLDRALIEAQQEDPFFSFSEFAEKHGITDATVRNRIKRLKSSGVIDVVTVINPYKVGFDTFAIIGVKLRTHASSAKFVESLKLEEGVSAITMVAGSFDFFVTYVCPNLEEYRRFVFEKLQNIPEVASIESFIGLDLYERKFMVGLVR